jgi:hypothetical protein
MEKRVQMAEWFQEHPNVIERLWFSDEAHFWLCGHVNSHNAVHWGRERPDKVISKPLHSEKVTVWAAMHKGQKLIGPFFFEDENEKSVSISSETYIKTALKPFWNTLGRRKDIKKETEWFQQDGATPHTSRDSMAWLQRHFPGRHVSNKAVVSWAPHSPDLSPLDFMLWGHLKSKVYVNKPDTIQNLKAAIRKEMKGITVGMVDRTIDHLQRTRLRTVIQRSGRHFEHLV